MSKYIRKYGWWAITLTLYVAVLVAYVSPLPGWVWFFGGVAFMAFWVKAETVADAQAIEELADKKAKQQIKGDGSFGQPSYSTDIHLQPWNNYQSNDEVASLREAILKEMEEEAQP